MRVRRQLVDQHRQRLLRRPAVLGLHLGRLRRHEVRGHRRPGLQGPADRDRREGPRLPGRGRLAELRLGPVLHPERGWRGRLVLAAAQEPKSQPSAQTEQPAAPKAEAPKPAPKAESKKTVETPTGKKVKKGDGEYKVKKGDTLSKIADEHDVKGGWHKVYKLNGDIIDNADMIFPGQQLHLS